MIMSDEEMQDWIAEMVARMPPLCAGLIDQDRYIGSDPVGHACHNTATANYWLGGVCWRVCESCLASLRAGEGRVTLPPWKAGLGSE